MRHLAQLDFAGPDAAAFLQGYLTADLDQLEPGRGLPTALCNIKGRVIANGWVAGRASRVHLFVHPSVADVLARELGKYLMFAKSTLERAEGGLHLATLGSAEAIELPPVGFYASPTPTDAGHAEFANACVDAGLVLVTRAIAERFLPQMIGLGDLGAVNFAKGCYLGQEVVARAEYRGQIKQRLRRYRLGGPSPAVGTDVLDDSQKIGTVVSVGDGHALAVTRSDASPVVAGGCSLTISA